MPHNRHHQGRQRSMREWRELASRVVARGVIRPTRVGPLMVYPDGAVLESTSDLYAEGRASAKGEPGEPVHGRRVVALQAPNKLYIARLGTLGPASTGTAIPHTWQQSGLVIGLSGSVADNANTNTGSPRAFGSIEIQIHIAGSDEDLVVNGSNATDFANLSAICGTTGEKVYAIERYVVQGEVWQITPKNVDGALTLLPTLVFAFKRDPWGLRQIDPS